MKTIDYYMKLPYKMEIIPDKEEGRFVALFPELPGCITVGDTIEEIVSNILDAKRAWLEAELEEGHIIPEPAKIEDYSKRIVNVKADEAFNLYLTFDNGENRIYNMQGEMNGVFEVLKDKTKFQSVFVDEFGNVAWDIDDSVDSKEHWENRIDICKDAIYMNSTPDSQKE